MTDELSGPELVYQTKPEDYDRLINAEDAQNTLRDDLLNTIDFKDKICADIGAGTGRLSRWVAPYAKFIHLSDAAAPMLTVAQDTLNQLGFADKIHVTTADARQLPLDDQQVDIAMAGWVYGHFRYWMFDGWEDVLDKALAEMARVTKPGGDLIIIETMGTGVEQPQSSPLDVYYDHLRAHGFTSRWLRTDYAFETIEEAVDTMSMFFGEAFADTIRKNNWTHIPECTAVFLKKNP